MPRTRIKVGDQVKVMRGADRGEQGRVLRVFAGKNRAIVEGVGTVFKHVKPTQQSRGGRIEKNVSVHISNLALIDPKSGAMTRPAVRDGDDGRERYDRKTGESF